MKRKFSVFGILLCLCGLQISAQHLSSRSSWSSSGAISKQGELYVWGDNFSGQLGIGSSQNRIDPPQKISLPEVPGGWKDFSPTVGHSFALTNSGEIYASGSNYSGALSIPGSTGQIHTFHKIISPDDVDSWKAISTSAHFSMALSSDGRAFVAGLHMFDQSLTETLMQIPAPDGVTEWKQIAAGESYAMLLSGNGRLYTWGANSYGRLGVDSLYAEGFLHAHEVYPVLFPSGVDEEKFEYTKVITSFEHTLAIGNDGNLYAAGNNSSLQSGQPDPAVNIPRMSVIPKPNINAHWTHAIAGRDYSVGLMSDGKMYRIGGMPLMDFIPEDMPEGFFWKDAAANDYEFTALGSNGTVYVSTVNVSASFSPVLQKFFSMDEITLVQDERFIPHQFALQQNFPNPFNPATTIGFTLQVSGFTSLRIYDVIGREVTTLVNEYLEADVYHQKTFDGSKFASGVYFYRLQSGTFVSLKKMSLIK